jgi:uncharacterized RDD family membrane protein YckC
MADDQPGPPARGDREDQPTQPQPPASPPVPTAPLPGTPSPPPSGPPSEALAGFWVRLAAAFIDWLLVGIVAGAIGALFGVDTFSPQPDQRDGFRVQTNLTGPFILVELVYFTYFHATSAGQSIGNKVLGIRVLDADTGAPLPYVRAFVRALMSNVSALPCFLGFFWMLWDRRKRTWHDIVADSLVVRASYYPPGEFGRLPR